MPPRRRIDPEDGREAVRSWLAGPDEAPRDVLASAVRWSLEELSARAPGASTEVRVPPFGVTQCIAGARHTRGIPPSVVETDPGTWLRLVTGRTSWEQAQSSGRLRASGERADLTAWLPLLPS